MAPSCTLAHLQSCPSLLRTGGSTSTAGHHPKLLRPKQEMLQTNLTELIDQHWSKAKSNCRQKLPALAIGALVKIGDSYTLLEVLWVRFAGI